MVRFGRVKKKTKAEPMQDESQQEHLHSGHYADPDSVVLSPHPEPHPPSSPRVSLPHVDTLLNMHQHNGLFDAASTEEQNGPTAVVTATDCSTLSTEQTDHASSLSLSPNPTNGDASSTTEWSSAVGHATTGKSSRVIHTLQEDIARLTREVGVYRSRAEETQRMNDAYKTQVQNMGERLRNLELANETNLQSISRKDQKIKDLRAEVQSEKDRRQNAEGTASHANRLMAQERDEHNRKCAELQEIANCSRTQYDVLANSRQRENAEQQKRFKVIRDDFYGLKAQQENKHVELERLDTIMAQKNREIEAGRENFDKLFEDYEAYKKAHDEDVQGLINRGHHGEAKLDAALASLKATEGQMKWVILNSDSSRSSNSK